MRRICLWIVVAALGVRPVTAQNVRLPGPPLVERHAHVRDGALIGAGIGGLAGAIAGLAHQNQLCPTRVFVCRTPQAIPLALVSGLAIGGAAGGIAGGIVGAFVKTSGRESQVGVSFSL